jgi:pyruvate/2-oxoglutarate dehydrogenase complex dihydrolipoamide dehydrogenase (E3) component
MKTTKFDFDVAILGAGSAGYAAARTAASAGLKTVVIEGGKEVGGLCILRGCMPSKALLYAAEVLHLARNGKIWGLKPGKIGFDFKKVMARKAAMIEDFAGYRRKQLDSGKFKFIRANACFVDAHTLALEQLGAGRAGSPLPAMNVAGQTHRQKSLNLSGSGDDGAHGVTRPTITARHFVIGTGSVVSPPPLPSLEEVGYITSDHALSLTKLPKSLIVLGGGAIACELAQFFARFDVKVTQIQRSPHVLREFDDDAGAVIKTVFQREGIKLFTGTKLLNARRNGKRKVIEFEQNGKKLRAEADEILLALGRSPNTATLGLENAGVETENGRITTDTAYAHERAAHLRSGRLHRAARNRPHRDPAGGNRRAQHRNPRRPRAADYRLLTSVVFTDPQVATVGLTEKEATARKIPFRAASYPFNDHGKSLIMEALDGFVKLLANPKTGEILGGCCVGPVGGELIHEINVAMAKRMTVHEFAATPHYHPTLAEIWTYPAEELAEQIPVR